MWDLLYLWPKKGRQIALPLWCSCNKLEYMFFYLEISNLTFSHRNLLYIHCITIILPWSESKEFFDGSQKKFRGQVHFNKMTKLNWNKYDLCICPLDNLGRWRSYYWKQQRKTMWYWQIYNIDILSHSK